MTRPQTIADIPTPALILDVAALDRNIQQMASFFAEGSCKLRPHFKAHKTPEIARRQLAAGSCVGLTCATISEAEVAADFCDDILIANEIAGPGKCERVAALAQRAKVTVVVDSTASLMPLAAVCAQTGVTVGVLVDINLGQARCGVSPFADAVSLAGSVVGNKGVELRGIMGYEGHLVAIGDRKERASRTRDAIEILLMTAQMIRDDSMDCKIVSAGGTGTYDITGRMQGVTEIQAGSYALMDSDYARLELPFEQAFWVLGTVISRVDPNRCVADCGHKSTTKDHGNPLVENIQGASVVTLNDEHATISLPPDSPVKVGDAIKLRPSHVDPTINLHDVFYALDGDRVIDVWSIAARGYAEHRQGG